jgi:hypothetical protein
MKVSCLGAHVLGARRRAVLETRRKRGPVDRRVPATRPICCRSRGAAPASSGLSRARSPRCVDCSATLNWAAVCCSRQALRSGSHSSCAWPGHGCRPVAAPDSYPIAHAPTFCDGVSLVRYTSPGQPWQSQFDARTRIRTSPARLHTSYPVSSCPIHTFSHRQKLQLGHQTRSRDGAKRH